MDEGRWFGWSPARTCRLASKLVLNSPYNPQPQAQQTLGPDLVFLCNSS